MGKRLLYLDPVTGMKTWHEYDHLTDTTTVSYEADSTEVLEANKRLANDTDFSKQGIKQDFWLYASIPAAVQMDWLINHGVDILKPEHGPRMSKLLNDPDYRHLKTTTKNHKFK